MTALAPLLVFFALGALARASGRAPEGLGSSLNWWILNLALPALLLELIPGLGFDVQYWFLVVAMWLVFAGAWAGAVLLGRLLHWSRERVGAVTLMAGLGNCTFIGYPMIEALHGRDGLALAVIADQLGLLFVLTVGATMVAASCSGRDAQPSGIAHRILVFPPFLAVLAGLVAACHARGAPAFEAAMPILSQLLKAEMAEREVRSIAYHMKSARFPAYKDLSGFDFAASEINEATVRTLHRCEFMDDAHNVVLIGGPGTGKTQVSIASRV